MPISNADALHILQNMLDLLSTTPGAIIYRGPNRWEALEPGNIGDVLTLTEELLPAWQPPS